MAMMPASGSARTTRFVRLVPVTGLPAHAVLLTTTTNAIVPAQTSRFDHRCGTPALLRVVDDEPALAVVLGGRIDPECERRLVVVPIEGAGLDWVDALEHVVDHLHADQTRAADLAADVDLRDHAIGIEVVHPANCREQVRAR